MSFQLADRIFASALSVQAAETCGAKRMALRAKPAAPATKVVSEQVANRFGLGRFATVLVNISRLGVFLLRSLALILCLSGVAHGKELNEGKLPRTSEYVLRALARSSPRPQYPPQSIRQRHQGIAVAWVEINSSGSPETVRVLQAPDDLIAGTLRRTLSQWRFSTSNAPLRYCGKITYYFRLSEKGAAVVAGDEPE